MVNLGLRLGLGLVQDDPTLVRQHLQPAKRVRTTCSIDCPCNGTCVYHWRITSTACHDTRRRRVKGKLEQESAMVNQSGVNLYRLGQVRGMTAMKLQSLTTQLDKQLSGDYVMMTINTPFTLTTRIAKSEQLHKN